MNATQPQRNYNCKDEELPVISKFLSNSLKRDLLDFTGYSPRFNLAYVEGFDAKITYAINLINPQEETIERKLINDGIHSRMSTLIDPINRLNGYISFSSDIKLSTADFGVSALRSAITSNNAENVMVSLPVVNSNITKYEVALKAQGMSDELIAQFADAALTIDVDYHKQHTIVSNRRGIVQNNIGTFNDLYNQLGEIITVGKILYKSSDPAKLQDYTFSHLKNEIHPASKTPVLPPDTKIEKE